MHGNGFLKQIQNPEYLETPRFCTSHVSNLKACLKSSRFRFWRELADSGKKRDFFITPFGFSSSSAVWQRAFQRSMCAIQIAQYKVLYEVRISLLKTFKQTHARCPGGIALSHRRPLLWPEERSIKNLHTCNIVQCWALEQELCRPLDRLCRVMHW